MLAGNEEQPIYEGSFIVSPTVTDGKFRFLANYFSIDGMEPDVRKRQPFPFGVQSVLKSQYTLTLYFLPLSWLFLAFRISR